MTDEQDLQNLLEEINAIDDSDIRKCYIPFEIYIYEAERLHTRATEDLQKLRAINMPEDLLSKLRSRTNALRSAQLIWTEQGNSKKKAREDWEAVKPEFLKLYTDLIQHFQFAFRNDKSLLLKLSKIKKGNSFADLSMNLSTLSVLGKENADLLTAINFDLSRLNRAAEGAKIVGRLRGNINGKMYFKDDKLVTRNKAYTLLKACVDEIRNYGQFAFRDQIDIAKAYSSIYRREKQKEYRKRIKMEASVNQTNVNKS